jgi:hypothetical protein
MVDDDFGWIIFVYNVGMPMITLIHNNLKLKYLAKTLKKIETTIICMHFEMKLIVTTNIKN